MQRLPHADAGAALALAQSHRPATSRWMHAALLAAVLGTAGCSGLMGRGPAAPSPSPVAAAQAGPVWSASMESKRIALEKATLDTGIVVFRTPDNQLQVNVPSDFSFGTDSAAIKPAMRPVLDRFADDLALPALSHLLVRIVGHTDDRGSDAANDQLSLARARSVAKYIEGQGIAADRITVEGHGEHEPSVTNAQPYGRALNRRVEMFLREPGSQR